jgi:antitoxin component YwqK of YwqJK toxin-antitoxin module
MLRPTVTNVFPKKNYLLLLEFDNGEKKEFDVKPYIKGSWFGKLKDESYFKSVRANGFNIEWPEGQDICPDDLYFNGKKE